MVFLTRNWFLSAFLYCCGGLLQAVYAQEAVKEETLHIAVDIPPVADLVSQLTHGEARVDTLLTDQQSPHHFQLSASQVETLQNADIIIIVSKELTPELTHTIEKRNSAPTIIELAKFPDITLLPYRSTHNDNHKRAELDPHIWLDPILMKTVMTKLAATLAPHFFDTDFNINKRLDTLLKQLDTLHHVLQAITQEAHKASEVAYVSAHDSYQYFEQRYKITAPAPLFTQPKATTGTRKQLKRMERISESSLRCILSESEMPLISRMSEATGAKTIRLSPVYGPLDTEASAADYKSLLVSIAQTIEECVQTETNDDEVLDETSEEPVASQEE